MSLLSDALAYAEEMHRDQRRKGTSIPYLSHPLAVAALVMEHGGDEAQVAAALLHDVPEDCGGGPVLADIRRRFGAVVADIVAGCSDSLVEDPRAKEAWRTRKERYLAHLQDAAQRVLLVSLADKVHNTRSLVQDLRRHGPATLDRFTGRRDGTLWYYRSLASVFAERGAEAALRKELDLAVEEMGRLAGDGSPS